MTFPFLEVSVPAAWLPVGDAVLKSTMLLAVAGAAALLLRRASAAARHTVWTLGLAGALALPALAFVLPRWELAIITFAGPGVDSLDRDRLLAEGAGSFSRQIPVGSLGMERAESPAPQTARAEVTPPALAGHAASATGEGVPAERAADRRDVSASVPSTVSWPTLLLTIWLAGCLLILMRLVAGLVAVAWMTRRTARVTAAPWLPLAHGLARTLGISSPLAFLRSPRATMPMAWGIVRPSVVMPADADNWPSERLRIVLLHELAHVKRRDCLTHVVAQLACALYWFNPLVWIAARRARAERERACDDLVLAAGTRGSDYADQLLQIARVQRSGRFPALLSGATLAMAHRTQLEGRLMAILDPNVRRSRMSRARTTAATAAVACAVLLLATLQPWAYAEPAAAGTQPPAIRPTPAPGPMNGPEPATAPEAAQRPQPVPEPAPAPATVEPMAAAAAQIALKAVADGLGQALAHSVVDGVMDGAIEGSIGAIAEQAAEAAESKRKPADPRTVAALTAALQDSDAEVREAAMHALVQLRDPSIYEPLVAALNDASADIREAAAMGLGQLRDRRAVAPLTSALKDSSASVREQAVQALGQLRDKSSGAALAQALQDASADVREQAAFALGQLRDAAYLDALSAALSDSSPDVREQAAFALGQLRDRRSAAALTKALSDASDAVREQAVFALGQLRDPAAVDSLVQALRDAKPDVREQAAFALGQIRDTRSVSALIPALKDASADVREQAAFALGQLGDRSAVEALVIALKDASADVREQVAFALGQLEDPRAIEPLTQALKDASADVRRQAAFALGQIAR